MQENTIMGIVLLIIDIAAKAYAGVYSEHSSTLAAMGSWTLKRLASIVGTIGIAFGLLILVASCS